MNYLLIPHNISGNLNNDKVEVYDFFDGNRSVYGCWFYISKWTMWGHPIPAIYIQILNGANENIVNTMVRAMCRLIVS